jgi:hypothetical protein
MWMALGEFVRPVGDREGHSGAFQCSVQFILGELGPRGEDVHKPSNSRFWRHAPPSAFVVRTTKLTYRGGW